jgi:hypothetical protein
MIPSERIMFERENAFIAGAKTRTIVYAGAMTGLKQKMTGAQHKISPPARAAQWAIRGYQLSLSAFLGRHCRYLPTCSDYTSQAIGRYGLWGGGWMGFARICRCRPGGGEGFDPVPETAPHGADAAHFWRYGVWRAPLVCAPAEAPPKGSAHS